MLRSLRIDTFRGLSDLDFDPLSRINVLTGFNNSGKTSILEGLYLLLGRHQQLVNAPTVFRSGQPDLGERYEHFWKWLLPDGDMSREASLHVMTEDNTKLRLIIKKPTVPSGKQPRGLTIQFLDSSRGTTSWSVSADGMGSIQERPWPKVQFFSPRYADPLVDADLFNKVQLVGGGEETLVNLLKVIEPRLLRLRYAKPTKQALVFAEVGMRTLIPTSQMGQAFCRLLTLYMEMLATPADVLLIDEIENGLHYSVFEEVWKGIASLSEAHNIQVFATTHSEECVYAAEKAAPRHTDHGFSHHRLELFHGQTIVNTSSEVLGRSHPPKVGQIMRREAEEARSSGKPAENTIGDKSI